MRTPALGFALLLVVAAVAPASALAADAGDTRPTPAIEAHAGGVPAATAPDSAGGARDADALADRSVFRQADDEAAPRTTVEISLRPDRSARWRVETHYPLESENETRAFRSLASRYEAGEADAGPDATLFRSLQERASEATGRTMAVENVTYHSSVDESEGRGTLALTFRWTNFLRAGDNETLVLDDAFRLPTAESDERRTWLSIFDADQEITIRPPDGYAVTGTSIPVQQRQSAVVLTQPSDFEGEEELRITYAAVGPTDQLPVGLLAGGGILAVAALLTGAWWFLWRRDDEYPGSSGPTTPGDPGAPGTPSSDAGAGGSYRDGVQASGAGVAAGAASNEPGADGAGGRSAGGSTGVAAGADAAADADGDPGAGEGEADVDLSLLSDEERVEHLLTRNGGRMKQATIVDETGWSDAKVSQLLSAMADEGRVEKLRLGRENLISLPDDADDAGAAADERG